MLLEEFKAHCINYKPEIVVQKFLIESPTFFFNTVKEGEEYDFKKEIAGILGIHFRDILIVGSGKLGFSIKPDSGTPLYRFKSFDHDVDKGVSEIRSDLDVAIVSSNLFDNEIENLYNHMGYYKDIAWPDRNSFGKYMLMGRLAIRFLPNSFPLTRGVAKVQEKYKMEYGRIVNIEIYKSWHYFETYHRENIRKIQVNLIAT